MLHWCTDMCINISIHMVRHKNTVPILLLLPPCDHGIWLSAPSRFPSYPRLPTGHFTESYTQTEFMLGVSAGPPCCMSLPGWDATLGTHLVRGSLGSHWKAGSDHAGQLTASTSTKELSGDSCCCPFYTLTTHWPWHYMPAAGLPSCDMTRFQTRLDPYHLTRLAPLPLAWSARDVI